MSVDRASTNDLVMLAMDTRGRAAQNIGAVLLLTPRPFSDPGGDLAATGRLIADRIGAIPRLRQRLRRVPPGCGGPVWVDDPHFDAGEHIRQESCPPPGDRQALLALAVAICGQPLPFTRPLWAAVLVTGLADDKAALVMVMHHVMADGIGGLAVLASLLDRTSHLPAGGELHTAPQGKPSGHRPSAHELIVDAFGSRVRALAGLPAALRSFPRSVKSAGGLHPPAAQSCSLLQRTGPDRQIAVATVDLELLRSAAHGYGATVNDALLAAVAVALHQLLSARGESLDQFRIAVPVAGRRAVSGGHIGNDNAPLVVEIPATGDPGSRLRRISQTVRSARSGAAGSSLAAMFGPVFRVLAALGAYRFYAGRQHRFHTMVSNLRGPQQQLTLAGSIVESIIPLSVGQLGNVTVSFLALSYAGTLTVTTIVDPDRVPDLPLLADALQKELEAFARLGSAGHPGTLPVPGTR